MTGHTSDEVIRPSDVDPRDEEGSLAGFPERDRGIVQDSPGNSNVGTVEAGEIDDSEGVGPEANIRDDQRAEDNSLTQD